MGGPCEESIVPLSDLNSIPWCVRKRCPKQKRVVSPVIGICTAPTEVRTCTTPTEVRVCAAPGCDKTFVAKVYWDKKYCCSGHAGIGRRGWSLGLTKETNESIARMAEVLTGRIQSDETIEKKSKALIGRSYVQLMGEEKAAEVIRKKKLIRGPLTPSWRGGIKDDPYSFDWTVHLKEKVKIRDGYICQLCGKSEEEEVRRIGRRMPVHHINYDKQDCSMENLITLCCSCNGKCNTRREYWTRFFQRLLVVVL